jgi:CRISPR-associated protein Cas2
MGDDMEILVAYDVSTVTAAGERRLRRIAQICLGFGQRVQHSVFECSLTEAQFEALEDRLVRCIDPEEDSLRIYRLVEPRARYIRAYGRDRAIDLRAPLIV